MKKIMLLLPVVFSIFMMGSAMAALKPYCQEKITTSVFNFFPDTIDAYEPIAYDSLGDPKQIDIYYLEYGRASAQVTKTSIPYSYAPVFYQGKLYFYAAGSYLPDPSKLLLKPWTITLTTYANQKKADIQCDPFSYSDMKCTGYGTYRVTKALDGGTIPVCIEFESHAYLPEATTPDTLHVRAWKDECNSGELVLDAEASDYSIRVPQKHVIFNWWDNFARWPDYCGI